MSDIERRDGQGEDERALRARVLVACIETESALARHEVEHGDGWLYNHADVIRGYKTELEALLRSEPREEVSTKDLDAGCYKVIDDMERSEPRGEEPR